MFHHQHCTFVEKWPPTKCRKAIRVELVPLVGRIEEHNIKRGSFTFEQIQRPSEIRFKDPKSAGDLQTGQVFTNDRAGFPRLVDEISRPSHETDGFKPDRPNTAKT